MVDRELVERVLADPEWTRRVVEAAACALLVLNGPETTADGDDSRLSPRTGLESAFMDETAIRAFRLPVSA